MGRQRRSGPSGQRASRAKPSSKAFEQARDSAARAAREASEAASRAARRSRQRRSGTKRRLAKSRSNKKLAGVAGGIANYLGLDATLVRIAFVIGAIFGNGFTIPLYIILAFVLPREERVDFDRDDDDPIVRVIRD
ncbi:MAG: PspC domain-containing protein [Rhodothermaceae bacterium]|nr:PspC domain-containing protein [Rhodothermaceae bacterium]